MNDSDLVSLSPRAIVCADDVRAAGVYQAARDAGLAIPHDLSVASCYALSVAEILVPSLTALTSAAALAGAPTVQLGLALTDGGLTPASKSLPMPLVIRESTAPPSCPQR